MAKKTDSTTKPAASNGAAPAAPAPVKRAVKPAAKAKPAAKKAKAPAVKAKRSTKTATTKAATPVKPHYTQEDVALRAYFISEKRRAHGLPGDEHHDWIEAERQVLAESTKPKKAKKA